MCWCADPRFRWAHVTKIRYFYHWASRAVIWPQHVAAGLVAEPGPDIRVVCALCRMLGGPAVDKKNRREWCGVFRSGYLTRMQHQVHPC